MESFIKMVLDQNWADLTKVVEARTADKVKAKIQSKKQDIIAQLNDGMMDDKSTESSTEA